MGKRAEGRRNMKEALLTTEILVVEDGERLEGGTRRCRRRRPCRCRCGNYSFGGRSPQSRRKIGRELWALLRYGILSRKARGGNQIADPFRQPSAIQLAASRSHVLRGLWP